MALVFMIPGPLRELTGDRAEVEVEVEVEGAAGTVSEALSLLWARWPAVRDRMMTELGEVRPHVNIFVDGQNIRDGGGLGAPVRDGAEIFILPAVSGG
jgi:MoaD family protein